MSRPFWRRADVIVYTLLGGWFLGQFAWVFRHPVLDDLTVLPGRVAGVRWLESDGGDHYFSLHGDDATYGIHANTLEITAVLEASRDSGQSMTVNVHLDGAMFIEAKPRYWVESIEFRDKKYGPFEALKPKSWRRMPAAMATLLRANLLELTSQDAAVLRELDAIDLGSLPVALRARALETRGSAADDSAYPEHRAVNDDDDALLLRALRDFRAGAELAPDDFELQHRQTAVLEALGAYDQALANTDQVLTRWPEQNFRVIVKRAALYRTLGQYDQALREIDTLRKPGEPMGMMFHYHRAWTLTELGRFADAEAEIGAGLENQPDYFWAFQKRACARGQRGRIALAIQDQGFVVAELTRFADLDPNDITADRLIEHRGILANLEKAHRENPDNPTRAGCTPDSPSPRYSRREPSPLLGRH